jgi:hypothetical protein
MEQKKMATLNEMFKALTKKQKESLFMCDCRDDYEAHIKVMYDFNQLPRKEQLKKIKESQKYND